MLFYLSFHCHVFIRSVLKRSAKWKLKEVGDAISELCIDAADMRNPPALWMYGLFFYFCFFELDSFRLVHATITPFSILLATTTI